jgi:hypothetical protein
VSLIYSIYYKTLCSLVSSSVETFSLVQDIDPPMDCAPKEVTFRPDFPQQLKLRCLPFGSGNEIKLFQKFDFIFFLFR